MKRKKVMQITIPVLAVVFIAGLISIGYSNHAIKNKNTTVVHAVQLHNKEVDISKVNISKDMEEIIRKSDVKNVDKNIKNYKMLMAKLEVPEKYRNEVDRLIKIGYKVPDTLIAYEFLNENYGQMKELEQLLSKNKSVRSWSKVFEDYKKAKKEFVPRNFDSKTLDQVMNMPGITPDDVMNADRISQMGLKNFNELIKMRTEGKTWKEINDVFGILNTYEKSPMATIDNYQIEKYCKETSLPKDVIVEATLIAAKSDIKDEEIIKYFKEGKSKGYVYEKYYSKLYK